MKNEKGVLSFTLKKEKQIEIADTLNRLSKKMGMLKWKLAYESLKDGLNNIEVAHDRKES